MSFLDEFNIEGVLSAADKALERKPKEHETWIKSENRKYTESRKPFWASAVVMNSDHITYAVQTKRGKYLPRVELSRKLEEHHVTLPTPTNVLVKFTGNSFVIIDYEIIEEEKEKEVTDDELALLQEEYNNLGGVY